ncbi:hypothetical protein ACFQ7O_37985 [Streptomyces sp. NPDC056485]|uniref:hypothetical protein n=1 Tax=unclassified Streptomyces TaxID=2593676 RepID=UPI0036B8D5A7
MRRPRSGADAADNEAVSSVAPAFRAAHGPGLLALFTRLRGLLSEPAWRDCRAVLGGGPS